MPRKPNSSRQTRAVLAELSARAQTWRHGYDICEATGLSSGTVYPILIRLHDQGLLEAEWRPPVSPGIPPRHVYRLTAAGLRAAADAEAPAATDRSAPGVA
ncbi:MAG TPA: PadR family transcriptional regulator [Allosphingosinicella sp.]|nr:PadR family transcriptional regulator [Allosphingosinicella sp.]